MVCIMRMNFIWVIMNIYIYIIIHINNDKYNEIHDLQSSLCFPVRPAIGGFLPRWFWSRSDRGGRGHATALPAKYRQCGQIHCIWILEYYIILKYHTIHIHTLPFVVWDILGYGLYLAWSWRYWQNWGSVWFNYCFPLPSPAEIKMPQLQPLCLTCQW